MKKSRNLLLLIISGISIVSCYPTKKSDFKYDPKIKNVIYMIGDGMNLADSLKLRGYEVDTSMNMIVKSNAAKLAGFIAPLDPPFRLAGRGDMLSQATGKAIEILNKNPKGFFLMIEGSQIDWAAHNN